MQISDGGDGKGGWRQDLLILPARGAVLAPEAACRQRVAAWLDIWH